MIRKYKDACLAMTAMFAFGAIVAQGASANPLTVDSSLNAVYITGTNHVAGATHTLTVEPGVQAHCKHATYKGSAAVVNGQVNHITLAPEYTECTAFGFATADIKVNGCIYTLTTPTLIKPGEVTWDAATQIHMLCPVGKKLEITPTSFGASVCTVSIGEQTPGFGHLVARNAGSSVIGGMDLTDEATLGGMTYTSTNSACGKGGSTASVEGKTTAICYSNALHTLKTDCTFS